MTPEKITLYRFVALVSHHLYLVANTSDYISKIQLLSDWERIKL